MALRDHFKPPLSVRRHWHAFHNAWATYLASHLNQQLPEGYFAEANVQFGIEIDVAAFEESESTAAGMTGAWTAPAPTRTVPVSVVMDGVEVQIYDREGGPNLTGAIELVSPSNKDRPEHRDAFVSKTATYIRQGVGVMIVDVVTSRPTNLHEEILGRMDARSDPPFEEPLYAAAYRLIERAGQTRLEIWQQALAVGETLPTMPLWLRGGLCMGVDLNLTYDRTCQELRIPTDSE